MTPVIPSPESDYGSDFSFEEDNAISQAAPVRPGPESDYGSDFSLDDENVSPQMTAMVPGPESEYGSDFSLEEENALLQLLDDAVGSRHQDSDENVQAQDALPQTGSEIPVGPGLTAAVPPPAPAPSSLEAQPKSPRAGAEWVPIGHAKMPAPLRGSPSSAVAKRNLFTSSMLTDRLSYPDLSRALSDLEPEVATRTRSDEPSMRKVSKDTRSPIERFRSFPRKPLTVTDLSSGAWCELQYWYTLTMLPGGRKTRTAAMRGGTQVHQTLEDQVHTTVRVSIMSKEEAFALRLWNLVQGLRTLRDTGFTRELEVWGVIQGQVVNGIIDEASYTSPYSDLGEELGRNSSKEDANQHRPKQPSLKSYFDPHCRRVYLKDVKTRGAKSLPSGAATRPAKMQLFLYHRLLSQMASQKVDFSVITARYGLKANAHFSDAFMAQMGSLYEEIFADVDSDGHSTTSDSSSWHDASPATSLLPEVIGYRSIEQVVPLLESELRTTFPQGAASLGGLVAIEYRHRLDGHVIGTHTSPVDDEALGAYLDRNLAWWLGQKEPEGVDIEEAYKCYSCEFAEICQWRKDKETQFLKRKAQKQQITTPRA